MSFLATQCRRGFTLVELLTVIAIIGILSAITFGVVKGVNERAAIGQAKAELATLSQALEAYKRQYGDYPRAGITAVGGGTAISSSSLDSTAVTLFNSLLGWKGPKNNNLTATTNGKMLVDTSNFSLATGSLPPDDGIPANNAFIDPWGRPYVYSYISANSTDRWPGFILLSAGPDGKTGISSINASTGAITYRSQGENTDNITSRD